MRHVVRRISPWSAAKVGAIIGLALGALFGILFVAVSGILTTEFAHAGYSVGHVGWAGVLLVSLLGSMSLAFGFPCVAALYNLASLVGAPLVLDLTEVEASGDGNPPEPEDEPLNADPSAPLLDRSFFDAE